MPTRNVVLTDHQAELIEKLVDSGRYQNASEVLREGLRLVESREAEDRARLEALRKAIQVGIDDLNSGRYRQFDSFEDLDDYLGKVTEEVLAKRRTGRKRK
jgi:antitoxin ParD1/3/4